MKKLFYIKGMLLLMALIIMLANIRIASGQTGKEQATVIPDNINKIFQTSCMQCHGSNGGMMPTAKVDFSKWADYGTAKQAQKASMICSVVSKEMMPPKSVRKSNPELIPTKEQTDLICKWADSLISKEEKK